ncbi:phage integrase central domain-containing protein [Comamonas sp.]|uniref:tyrosine-type recombinase/integrase n=1 Tax=Comamonas sp. TaxID=34028 RepID=UPI0028B0DE8F|nr:integrase arm-type DNA-binding domain-containing protein [Comamonas sp.]
MSKALNRLTALEVKRISDPGMYHDGGGLYLQIGSSGSKSWILRYTQLKKTRDFGLGSMRDWTLAEARERAVKVRQMIGEGLDPIAEKQQRMAQLVAERKESERSAKTFAQCAAEYHESNKSHWKNAKHADQWINTLTTYVFPAFGSKPVSLVDREMIREALLPIWKSKAETATRVLQRIRTTINYAAARGYCEGLDSQQWSQLKISLPKNSKELEHKHHSSCPHSKVGALVKKVDEGTSSQIVKAVFSFIILTACRSGEARNAEWGDIDFDHRIWTIPKERMKASRPHSVPLSGAAWQILEALKATSGYVVKPKELIFPNAKGLPLSDMTLTQVLRRMDLDYTMHGFRSSFRTWGAEVAHYDHDMLEFALAHVVGDGTVRAYQRSDMVEKRRILMEDWASYVAVEA